MLVYLATYPRSGYAFTRTLIYQNFGILVASGYPAPPPAPSPRLELRNAPRSVAGFSKNLTWNDQTVVYRSPTTGKLLRGLKDDANAVLVPELRKRLAAEPNIFIVKTHERPFRSYFPGEMALRMVRHPGAALASYVRLLLDFAPEKAVSFSEAVRGVGVPGGRWSTYQRAWNEAAIPSLVLRYEDTFEDQKQTIGMISKFLGLCAPEAVKEYPVTAARAANAKRNPGRGTDGWRAGIAEQSLEMLWRHHGPMAETFGYRRDP